MEKINYLFGDKSLKICQDDKMFKFSLDTILLSSFVTIKKNCKRILDIGTGNAPIPVILSTKTTAKIIGIEIQKSLFLLANKTIKINNLENQIEIINEDIKEWYKKENGDKFDTVVCNPPFFKINDSSNLNQNVEKTIARHETMLKIGDVLKVAKKLLINGGNLAIVQRPERFMDVLLAMTENNIEPKRIKFIYSKSGKSAHMVLIEGTKNGKKGIKIEAPLIVHNRDEKYTKELEKYTNYFPGNMR